MNYETFFRNQLDGLRRKETTEYSLTWSARSAAFLALPIIGRAGKRR